MECKVLSDGDKLKAIRIKYDLKQDELSGNDITRNLISEIETGAANITKRTAEIIIKNLTELSRGKGFKVAETVEYLMENQIVQATKILDDYISELQTLVISKDGSFIEILKKAESFLIDWDIKDKRLMIYELAGDYYCNNNDMYKSVVYYEKASALLSKMFLDRKLIPLSRKLSMVYYYIGNYRKSIECCDFALSQFYDLLANDKVVFRYNNALNYKRINNFEKALKNIEIAEELVNEADTSRYIQILNTKANCLYEMKLYEEALRVFDKISDLIDENETDKYLINLINIVNSYLDAGIKDNARKTFDIVINQLPNLDNKGLCVADIYFEVGKIYKKLDKQNLSADYYLIALDFSEKQKNYILANEILGALIEMYLSSGNLEKVNLIKEKTFSIAIKTDKVNDVLMYKLIALCSKISSEKSIEIVNFALKFKKEGD